MISKLRGLALFLRQHETRFRMRLQVSESPQTLFASVTTAHPLGVGSRDLPGAELRVSMPDVDLRGRLAKSGYVLLPVVGKERGRRLTGEVGANRIAEERIGRASLLGAGGDGGPDTFAPLAATFTSCALRDESIDDDEPDRLFGEVVRGLHAGGAVGRKQVGTDDPGKLSLDDLN